MTLPPDRLERFARHIVLPEIGGAGQLALAGTHVVLIGIGGIGSPARGRIVPSRLHAFEHHGKLHEDHGRGTPDDLPFEVEVGLPARNGFGAVRARHLSKHR